MKKLLLLLCILLICGCAQPIKHDEEHRKFVKIAALKYLLYPGFTVKDFDNEVLYREWIRKQQIN